MLSIITNTKAVFATCSSLLCQLLIALNLSHNLQLVVQKKTMASLCKYLNCSPVKLHFEKYVKKFDNRLDSHKWINIVLLHGMLSTRDTFGVSFFTSHLAGYLQSSLNVNVTCYLVDARNHGLSPHTDDFSLPILTCDLSNFLHQHSIKSPLLVGHSMGGKTALLYALLNNREVQQTNYQDLSGIVSIDAAPSNYVHNHQTLFKAMQMVDFTKVERKHDINKQLKKLHIDSPADRGYAIENAIETDDGEWKWRCNLDVIAKNEFEIHRFPNEKEFDKMIKYEKESLFIGGAISSRLTTQTYIDDVDYWFPNNTIHTVPRGEHFVHRTHHVECIKQIGKYCQRLGF